MKEEVKQRLDKVGKREMLAALFASPAHDNVMGVFPFRLPSAKVVAPLVRMSGTAVTDFYTCPPRKRALICGVLSINVAPTGGVALSLRWRVKIGGVYYRISPDIGSAANAGTSGGYCQVLEAGESLAIDASGNQSAVCMARIIEFDASYPLYTLRNTNIVAGANLIADAGAKRFLIYPDFPTVNGNGNIRYANESGATRTCSTHIVSALDEVLDVSNQVSFAATASNNGMATSQWVVPPILEPTKKLVLKSDAAGGQHSFVTVQELDA